MFPRQSREDRHEILLKSRETVEYGVTSSHDDIDTLMGAVSVAIVKSITLRSCNIPKNLARQCLLRVLGQFNCTV
jgi:hypothetical protein